MKKAIILTLTLLMCLSGCENSSISSDNSSFGSAANTFAELVSSENNSEIETVEKPENFNITMTFLGDMILANQIGVAPNGRFEEYAEKNPPEYFLSKVSHILSNDDFTIANLENVFSDREISPVDKNYTPAFWFKTKTSNINILTKGSIEAVLLTNNHIMDYGIEGFNDTVNTVSDAGLKYGTDTEIINLEKNGFKIAIICTGLWGEHNVINALNKLYSVQDNSDFQIVFFHGGTEKLHAPEEMKINAAHRFVDNGADLVVGGHPHVLQPREIYNGVEIVYSVGNFCYGGAFKPENRTIIYQYTLTVNPEMLSVEEQKSSIIPCYVYTGNINNYQPAVIDNDEHFNKVLDFMNGKTDSPI